MKEKIIQLEDVIIDYGKKQEQIYEEKDYIKESSPSRFKTSLKVIPQNNLRPIIQIPSKSCTDFPAKSCSDLHTQYGSHNQLLNNSSLNNVLDGVNLDVLVSFQKNYSLFRFTDNSESNFVEQSQFKMEVQVVDNYGYQLQIKVFSDKLVAQENLSIEMVRHLLTLIQINDILPSNTSQISIKYTNQLIKHIIIPFITFQDLKIQIWPKALGILSGLKIELPFLDTTCIITLHHIEYDQFRVFVSDPISLESYKIDLELDSATIDHLFRNMQKDEYIKQEKLNILQATIKQQNQESFEQRTLVRELLVKQQQPLITKQYQLEELVIKDPQEIIKLIHCVVRTIEKLLISLNCRLISTLSYQKRYLRYKCWKNCQKGQAQSILDVPHYERLEVALMNYHETFGPNRTKSCVRGNHQHLYSSIQRELSLPYHLLSPEEKFIVMHLIIQSYNLKVFDKYVEYNTLDQSPIIHCPYDYGTSKRLILPKLHTPLTMSIIGINRRMIGVKITIYDILKCQETGMFLTTTQQDWDVSDEVKVYNMKASSSDNTPYSEFLITQIFNDPIITNILLKISDTLATNQRRYIDKIENLINLDSLINNY